MKNHATINLIFIGNGNMIDALTLWPDICKRLQPEFNQLYKKKQLHGALIFVDTETSGFKDADIIELGAISVTPPATRDGDVELDFFCQLIFPYQGYRVSPWATNIHGITSTMLQRHGHPPFETFQNFIEWIDQKSPAYLVAHCASFDKGMLEKNLLKHGIDYALPKFLCTVKMAKALPIKSRKLAFVASYYNFDNQQAHRAIADAEVCAYIYTQMVLDGIKQR
ncbi:MAG: 3'-5' exonuclease [Holophagaceae bacterium]|nr:3'-5' exonuclease [Holophagaceae bacterium]